MNAPSRRIRSRTRSRTGNAASEALHVALRCDGVDAPRAGEGLVGSSAKSSQRVRRRRDKLRAAGLRPIQIWVPDTRAPGFAEECRRQCRLLAAAENVDSDVDTWLDRNNEALADSLDR